MFTVQSKSLMAKLMATEDIKVEHHANAKTACFDLKKRTLRCPIWKDMNGDLYDLLMGHEISHALRTPPAGWHDALTYAGGNKKASANEQKRFKSFLNIVEDARIEKLVKVQYPGLRAPMIRAYKDLVARDFFGLSTVSDLNDLYLIDKLNLTAKVGVLLNIRFTEKEKPFVSEMEKLETWDDTVKLAKKLFAYSKTEQKEGEKKKAELRRQHEEQEEQEQSEDGEEYEGEEGEGGEEGEDGKDSEEGEDGKDSEEGEESEEDEKKGDKADARTTQKSKGRLTNQKPAPQDEKFTPQAKTDEHFRQKENSLVEQTNVPTIDVTIPTPLLKDAVVPASIANNLLTNHYNNITGAQAAGVKLLQEFKQKNDDYIMLLAKEFEMRKAARSYKHAKLSDTGDIDINKLAMYRLEDNMFRRLMVVNKGKSHGLVLLLDKSSSMKDSLVAATEQILIMALFCRKVNIPFTAYAFTNTRYEETERSFPGRDPLTMKPFSKNPGELLMADLSFRELLHSKMPVAEFNRALMNQLLLAQGIQGGRYEDSPLAAPSWEYMGSTPLNEALVVLRDILRQFRTMHRLDIVNTIIVHDGDSDGNSRAYAESTDGRQQFDHARRGCEPVYVRVTLHDAKEKVSFLCPSVHNGITTALLNWIQTTTGCGVFGFYVSGSSKRDLRYSLRKMYRSKLNIAFSCQKLGAEYVQQQMTIDQLGKYLLEHKFLESFTEGYTRFYFIPGQGELSTENGNLDNGGKQWTPSRLLSAFKKVSKKKSVSRVLVGRFIELIAS